MNHEDNQQIERLVDKLTPHLEDYLVEHGIIEAGSRKHFRCLSPHQDRTPSMCIYPKNRRFAKCFGCGVSMNIMHAAAWIEGKPLIGKGWIDDNVNYLARKYGFEEISIEFTEKDLSRMSAQKVHEMAADFLTNNGHQDLTEARGWEPETCKSLGIATLDDFDALVTEIQNALRIPRDEIYAAGLSAKLFGPSMITFTLRDPWGNVTGFARRDVNFEELLAKQDAGDKSLIDVQLSKYNYTHPSSLVFSKGDFVYNLNNARDEQDAIYIFEGQGSVVTCVQNDLPNCVATCGEMTEGIFKTLRNKGKVKDIILAFDYDLHSKTGQLYTGKAISKIIGICSEVRVQVLNWKEAIKDLEIPDDVTSIDADWFIQEYGIDRFRQIPVINTFQWKVENRLEDEDSQAQKEEDLVRVIMQETSYLTQDRYGVQLAQILDIDKNSILDEIKNLRKLKDNSLIKRQEAEFYKFQRRFKGAEDAGERLQQVRGFFDIMDTMRPDTKIITIDDEIASLEVIMSRTEDPEGIPSTAIGIPDFETRLGGDVKLPGLFCFIGAEPNTGKTALIQSIGTGILTKGSPDVKLLYFLNDDGKDEFFTRMVSNLTGIPINTVKDSHKIDNPQATARIKKAWNYLMDCTRNRRLQVIDNAFSLELILDNIRRSKAEHIGPLVVFVDSFTRVNNIYSNERERVEYTSSQLKEAAASWDDNGCTTIFCTSEVNKPTSNDMSRRHNTRMRPLPKDLKGSGKMEFDATLVIMLDNIMHRYKEEYHRVNDSFWVPQGLDPNDQANHKPVIRLHFDKNKRSEYKGKIIVRLQPEFSRMSPWGRQTNIRIEERTHEQTV